MRTIILLTLMLAMPAFGQGESQLPPGNYQLQVSRNGTLHAIHIGNILNDDTSDVIYRFDPKTNGWNLAVRLDWFYLSVITIAYDDLIVCANPLLADKAYVLRIAGHQLDSHKNSLDLPVDVSCIQVGYDQRIYVGTPLRGIFTTTMESWDTLRYPSIYSWDRIDDLLVTPAKLYACNNGAVISTSDNGQSWKTHSTASTAKIAVFGDTIYGVTIDGKFLRGVDTLSAISHGLPKPYSRYSLITDRIGTIYYHAGYPSDPASVMYSRDGGFTWNVHPIKGVTSIACDSAGIMYFAVGNKIYESPDNGASWNLLDVADEEKPESVMSYPNPVIADCVLTGVANGEAVDIYTMLGVKVATAYYDHGLDLRALASGVYRLVITGDQVRHVQIVKQ